LSRLLRLPAALLLELANEFLDDEDAQELACTCSSMPPLLRTYRIKESVPLTRALRPARSFAERLATLPASMQFLMNRLGADAVLMDGWLTQLRFGVPTSVHIDIVSSENPELGEQLQQLPLSVRSVHVLREAFNRDRWDRYALDSSGRCDRCANSGDPPDSPPPLDESFLRHVAVHLPAHIRSLIFEQDGMEINEEYEYHFSDTILPPIEAWSLPDGLTELHLPRCLWLYARGADVQLPPQLVKLRLGNGYEFDHSLAKLKLPPTLRVLHFGEQWNQSAPDWPSLPNGLDELELPGRFNQPLSSLHLPSSLRKLHFRAYHGLSNQKVSRLFDDPTPHMFPPHLLSLQLPPPLTAEQEAEQDEQVNIEQAVGRTKVRIWTDSTPLNLSLLPPSVRFLRIHRAQPLVCDPPSALDSLQLEQLRVFHRISNNGRPTRWHSGAQGRRERLRQQMSHTAMQYKAACASNNNNSGVTHSASSISAVPVSSAPTAEAPDVAQPAVPASVSVAPSFTMGARKQG
jgi:hypothetical protein